MDTGSQTAQRTSNLGDRHKNSSETTHLATYVYMAQVPHIIGQKSSENSLTSQSEKADPIGFPETPTHQTYNAKMLQVNKT